MNICFSRYSCHLPASRIADGVSQRERWSKPQRASMLTCGNISLLRLLRSKSDLEALGLYFDIDIGQEAPLFPASPAVYRVLLHPVFLNSSIFVLDIVVAVGHWNRLPDD